MRVTVYFPGRQESVDRGGISSRAHADERACKKRENSNACRTINCREASFLEVTSQLHMVTRNSYVIHVCSPAVVAGPLQWPEAVHRL